MTNKPKHKGLWLLLAGLVMLAVLLILISIIKSTAIKSTAEEDNSEPKHNSSMTESVLTNDAEIDEAESNPVVEDLAYTPNKFVTGVEQLPKSLQGTQVDGDIIINNKSELVPTPGLRRLYDYFLSALGEEDSDTVNARVEAYIRNTTPQPAADEALKIYSQYQTYLKQVSKIQSEKNTGGNNSQSMPNAINSEIDINELDRQQRQIKAIRSQLFDTEVEKAFFSTEDQLQAYNKQMLKIAQDKSLTASEKQKAKQAYLQRLPNTLTKQQAEQQANMEQLFHRTEQMKKRGAEEDELFRMRTELVGVEAAERLAKLDLQNQDFERRFENYQQQKQKIMGSNISQSAKDKQIQNLQRKMFSESEQKRLSGYEQFKNQ